MANIINIAAYKFVELDNLETLQNEMLQNCLAWQLKGTILLGTEGINLILAGERDGIDNFVAMMNADVRFQGMDFKESFSEKRPFRRMRVRLKKEIVTMKVEGVQPKNRTGKRISATELKQWLDEGRDFTFLDTRNGYEVKIGTFEKANYFDIAVFSEFPEQVQNMQADHDKPMVMFCTGGIRCEKASVAALDAGFKEVYQLEGGILKYFEEVGGEHYHGDCFVFDQRTAITPEFKETGLTQCPCCNHFITPADQQHPDYIAWKRCQYCPAEAKKSAA
jgi:UPF0176 protein